MHGLMMDVPLLTTSMIRHAANYHDTTEIVSRLPEGTIHRTTYAECWARCHRLANALTALGLQPGDRVGTLAWNSHRHLELYFGVAGAEMVCHTINPRLFPEQIAYIVNHAQDAVLFVDPGFVGLLESIAAQLPSLKAIIVLAAATHMPRSDTLSPLLCYEELLSAQSEEFTWPEPEESAACGLCYTSGTTGNPKGALYSHRSTVLHAMAICVPDVMGISARSVVMPVVPMFHVNAWGLPYAATITGSKLVMPGPRLDGASLYELIEAEGVTFTAGVPTIWMALLDWMSANGKSFSSLRRIGIGGSACPPVMIDRFRALGIEVLHAWGMTETSPVGVASMPKAKHRGLSDEAMTALVSKQGRPLFGMEFRIVGPEGQEVPRDGQTFGRLLVRSPWVASGYYGQEVDAAFSAPGWFETGDVVTMDVDGFMQVVDRTKDLVKSGGEWISSIELENIAVSHPAIREAAVVAHADEHWGERPVLVAVLRDGASLSQEEMASFFAGKVARYCIPDRLILVNELPHTATGKLKKSRIREMLCAGELPGTELA